MDHEEFLKDLTKLFLNEHKDLRHVRFNMTGRRLNAELGDVQKLPQKFVETVKCNFFINL